MSAQNVLLKELLDNYGYPSTRPVYDMYETTTVQFQLLLAQVIELVRTLFFVVPAIFLAQVIELVRASLQLQLILIVQVIELVKTFVAVLIT